MKLIIEMEMPECCDDCSANYDCCSCGISGAWWFRNPKYKEFDSSKERLPDCPIKGVLPDKHGDLIDKRELLKKGMDMSWSVQKWVQEVDIVTAPTIVLAERSET